jgi:N-succinyldiaminopimelate aminotransferase
MTSAYSPSADVRLQELGTTVFAAYSALAAELGAVNLGQGVPADGPPSRMVEVARASLGVGRDQYPALVGIRELREAVAAYRSRATGTPWDPDSEVLVTVGATEAIMAAILALAGPGDDVVVLEPAYDSYAAAVDLAGARLVSVPMGMTTDGRMVPDIPRLRAAMTPRTRALILNTPHNPSGTVLTRLELEGIADVLRGVPRVTLISDEVYEHLILDGSRHVSPASIPDIRGRTLAVSSAGKTFSATGWKVGWVVGPAPLIRRVTAVKQYLTFSVNGPFQLAVAHALAHEWVWVNALRESLRERRDLLHCGLAAAGFEVLPAQAGYFLLARPPWPADRVDLAIRLAHEAGVVAIPGSAFHRDADDKQGLACGLLRFAFCVDEARIHDAVDRLSSYARTEGTTPST